MRGRGHRQEQTRKELTIIVQKSTQLYKKYIKNYEYVTAEMCSLEIDQQCFLINLFSPTPLIPKATQIQYDEGDSRLAFRLAIAEHHMAEPKVFFQRDTPLATLLCKNIQKL